MSSQRQRVVHGFGAKFETIGPFRLRRYDELLGGEILEREDSDMKLQAVQLDLLRVAGEFATAAGLELQEAAKIMEAKVKEPGLFPEYDEQFRDYAARIMVIQATKPPEYRRKMEIATLFLNTRGEMQQEDGEGWEQIKDWTLDDTRTIPKDLIEAINLFAQNEREGWPAKRSKARGTPAGDHGAAPEEPADAAA